MWRVIDVKIIENSDEFAPQIDVNFMIFHQSDEEIAWIDFSKVFFAVFISSIS